ncbi:hypothetical protein J2T56_000333 [Natronobacillus azotifigens]|uniref:DUF1798 family protein n=1 Tax=Natronobacillus azotifigens TaxID=472978 RepID=A0A9J6R9E4_9BACI|nr:DUF1798 family protein [Natronobacillus azotifigens]MCZ0701892.1 DUF1798 family protein [Natronobacillus azotifigens]
MKKFLDITSQLKSELEKLKQRYLTEEKPENKRDPDFFAMAKAETSHLFQLIDTWEEEANDLIQKRVITSVHPQQVISTKENMELLLMHSYYIDVNKKRYMELFQSVFYVFDLAVRN